MNVLQFPTDQIELRKLMLRDGAAYVPTLANKANYARTVRELVALLPPHDSSLHATLWEGVSLPSRVAVAFGLLGSRANATPPLSSVFKAIRSAQGPAGEAVRALLLGVGDGPAALLRKVVEHRRGSPLPVVDINSDGSISDDIAAVLEAERAHVEAERASVDTESNRKQREKMQAHRDALKRAGRKPQMKLTPPAQRKANRAARAAAKADPAAAKAERKAARKRWKEAHAVADAEWRDKLERGDA